MKRSFFNLCVLFTLTTSVLYAQQGDEVNFKVDGSKIVKDPNPYDSVFFSLKDANVHPNRVKELSLEGEGLVRVPHDIFRYKNLQVLNLSYNALEHVPDSLFIHCKRLHTVRVAGNGWTQIPSSLLCATLKVLDLSENRIREIPSTISRCTQLEELDVHANEINQFPGDEVCLKNLRSLVLSDNPVGTLVPWIAAQRNLKMLFLEKTELAALTDALCNLQQLKLLDIEENRLTAFPNCLCHLKNLKVVMVFESGLDGVQLEKINSCNPTLSIR